MLPAIFKEVIKIVPEAHLLIAGDGDDVKNLQDSFLQAGIKNRVVWHGRFTRADMPNLLAQSHIIIDPIDASVTARAKSSFRAMVSLAYGRPLVTSNVGIRSQLIPIQFHDRFFATPGQPTDYAEKITALLRQPLTSVEQGELRAAASRYTWATLAHRYHDILKQI